MKAAVLTVSDGVSEGTREDRSGDLLEELLEGFEVIRRVVPDERDAIADAIAELAGEAELVLTTGGTGLGAARRDPRGDERVLDRVAPGIAEAIRADSIAKTPHAPALAWGRRRVRDSAGRQPARLARRCRDGFAVLQPALEHALQLLAGETQPGNQQT